MTNAKDTSGKSIADADDFANDCKNEAQIRQVLQTKVQPYLGMEKISDDLFHRDLHGYTEEEYLRHRGKEILAEEFNAAIQNGCVSTARLLLIKFDVKINNSKEEYLNSLSIATSQPNINPSMVRLLMEHGADPNIHIASRNNTILHGSWTQVEVTCFYTILGNAIHVKDTPIIQLLLEHGADPNTPSIKPDFYGASCFPDSNLYPLQHAIEDEDIQLTTLLLSYHADPNIATPYPQYEQGHFNLLYEAVLAQNLELIDLLLRHGANPNGNSWHLNPIEEAIEHEEFDIIKPILEYSVQRNASVENAAGKQENAMRYPLTQANVLSAIACATHYNSTKSVELIFSYYGDVWLNNSVGDCILSLGAWRNNVDIISNVTLHGSRINTPCRYSLPYDTSSGFAKEVSKLLQDPGCCERNACASDVYCREEYALLIATERKHTYVVQSLIAQGADVNIVDSFNHTALRIAVKASSYEIAKSLLENGANANYGAIITEEPTRSYDDQLSFNEYIDTFGILQIAVSNDNYEMAKLLLKYGADPNLKTAKGWLPITATISKRSTAESNYKLATLLLSHGADVHSEYHGMTLLHIAVLNINPLRTNLQLFEHMAQADASTKPEYTEMIQYAKTNIEEIREQHRSSIAVIFDFITLLINTGCDLNKYNDRYSSLTDKYGHSVLDAAIKYKDLEAMDLLLKSGANPNVPNVPRYSLLHSAIKSLDAQVLYKVLSYGAYPNTSDLPMVYRYGSKEISAGEEIKSLKVLFQFGAEIDYTIDEVEYRVGCGKDDEACINYANSLKYSISDLAAKYKAINLVSPQATNDGNLIQLSKPGYYWGLGGGDIFMVQVITQEQANAISTFDDRDPPIEELNKHPLIIMDFATNEPNEKIDLSNVPSLKSHDQLVLTDNFIHDRPSVSIGANIDGNLFELVSLCGVSSKSLEKSHFTFG